MIATMENLRALLVMDNTERCAMLKKHSNEYLEDIDFLAEAHKNNFSLKIGFIVHSKHQIELDENLVWRIMTRIDNTRYMAGRIMYERSYPNVPRRAESYGENEPALTEDEYKTMMKTLSEYCRENKE